MGIKRATSMVHETLAHWDFRHRKPAGPKSEARLQDQPREGHPQRGGAKRQAVQPPLYSIRHDVGAASAPIEAVVEPDSEDVHVRRDGNRRLHKVIGAGAEIEEIVFSLH